jgi:hypothetical protein
MSNLRTDLTFYSKHSRNDKLFHSLPQLLDDVEGRLFEKFQFYKNENSALSCALIAFFLDISILYPVNKYYFHYSSFLYLNKSVNAAFSTGT